MSAAAKTANLKGKEDVSEATPMVRRVRQFDTIERLKYDLATNVRSCWLETPLVKRERMRAAGELNDLAKGIAPEGQAGHFLSAKT